MAASAILLSSLSCSPDDEPDPAPGPKSGAVSAAQCERIENVFKQIECYVTLATDEEDPSMCGLSSHDGVKYQCYAILAERLGSRDLCDQIPLASLDHQELRDICISDVAKKILNYVVCDEIQTMGLRDSCYAKIGQETKNTTLCEKIQDPGLRSMCSGVPVMVE